ncbi:MAG: hypothetical protein QXI39_00290 [Candidatus Bathyarchaeia archaeon]
MNRVKVRVHCFSDYFYCCERSRLEKEGIECPENEVLKEGTRVHEWLSQRPRNEKEAGLWDALGPYLPISRTHGNYEIIGHPDDLAVLEGKKVQVLEYKTVESPQIAPWKRVLASFQVQLYAWILESVLPKIGYELAHAHKVVYLSRNGIFMKKATVEHDPYCTERKIDAIIQFWETGEPLIAPMKWKCKQCPETFREKCRLVGKE